MKNTGKNIDVSYQDILKINGNGILKASVNGEPYVAVRYTDSLWSLVFTLIEPEVVFYQSVFENSNTRSLVLAGVMLPMNAHLTSSKERNIELSGIYSATLFTPTGRHFTEMAFFICLFPVLMALHFKTDLHRK